MKYDALFLTNLPNYYKVNLFNEIAAKRKIKVVFIASYANQRNVDFNAAKESKFDFTVLNEKIDNRSLFKSLLRLWRVIRKDQFNNLILGEWVEPEYWFAWLLFPKKKINLMLESSIHSISGYGFKEHIKRIFLSRVHRVFANGEKHKALAKFLKFKGEIINSKGLGIINYGLIETAERSNKFLYVGRLSEEKNLPYIIRVFNRSKYQLTILGEGPLENELRELAGPNIEFKGYQRNVELGKIFQTHRALILISKHEPYGLVVEEAMYFGTPSIVSSVCGIVDTLCFDGKNCIIVDPHQESELEQALKEISKSDVHQKLSSKCDPEAIVEKNEIQVLNYVNAIG